MTEKEDDSNGIRMLACETWHALQSTRSCSLGESLWLPSEAARNSVHCGALPTRAEVVMAPCLELANDAPRLERCG
eukprot:2924189-Amphidinium_carterae.1